MERSVLFERCGVWGLVSFVFFCSMDMEMETEGLCLEPHPPLSPHRGLKTISLVCSRLQGLARARLVVYCQVRGSDRRGSGGFWSLYTVCFVFLYFVRWLFCVFGLVTKGRDSDEKQ